MKKRLSIFLLICSMLVSSIIGIDGVWADDDVDIEISDNYANGTSGEIGGCGGNNCYTGEVGFRVTIVDASGERCKYNSTTGELCGTTGELVKSKDYWFGNPSVDAKSFWSANECYAFKSKDTKIEFLSFLNGKDISNLVTLTKIDNWNYDVSSDYIGKCESVYSSPNTLYSLFGDLYTPTGWDTTSKLIEPTRNPKNMEKIIKWFDEEQEKGNTDVLNKVLTALLGENGTVTNISLGLDKASIQFEQLLMVTNYDKEKGVPANIVSFMGTVAQSSYLYMKMPTPEVAKTGNSRACTIQKEFTITKYGTWSDKNHTACGSSMFAGGYWTGWYGKEEIGSLDVAAANSPTRNIDRYIYLNPGGENGEKLTYDNFDLSYFYDTGDTSNVFTVKISSTFYGCANRVQNAYKAYKNPDNKEAYGKIDVYNAKVTAACGSTGCPHLMIVNGDWNIKNYGGSESDLANLDSCSLPSCNFVASARKDSFTLSTYKNLIVFLKNNYTDNNDTTEDQLKTPVTNDQILQLDAYYKNNSFVSNTNNLCELTSCDSILDKIENLDNATYKETLSDLSELFPNFGFLKPENLKALYGNENDDSDLSYLKNAACETTPYCPVSGTTASCNGSGTFRLSDTTTDNLEGNHIDRCLAKGVAYNYKTQVVNGETKYTDIGVQTSFDSEYGTSTNPGYCWEEVQFNFPKSPTDSIKAGTIFKWGKDVESENKDDKTFGEMIITRECYLTDSAKDAGSEITSDWANVIGSVVPEFTNDSTGARINPNIQVIYRQALPNDLSVEYEEIVEKLKVYLYSFESVALDENEDIALGDNNKVYYYENGEVIYDNPNLFDLKNNVITKATYDKSDGDNGNNPRQFTCNGDSCKDIEKVRMVATYKIVYGDEFKWYADKSNNGELVPAVEHDESATKNEIKASYTYAGYGLPTPFVTPTNEYCETSYGYSGSGDLYSNDKNGALIVKVNNIGTKNRTDSNYHFTSYVNHQLVKDDTDSNDLDITNVDIVYSCKFNVINELFDNENNGTSSTTCDKDRIPKGIDVVFRTIELVNNDDSDETIELNEAFPGRSGNGRELGANWAEWIEGNPNDPQETDHDINDILSASIYNQAPVYEITLDVPTIKKIREWNRAAQSKNIDPYTNTSEMQGNENNGYSGYSFYKNEESGYIRIASNFLTKLFSDGNLKTVCLGGLDDTTERAQIYSGNASIGCNQRWWKQ